MAVFELDESQGVWFDYPTGGRVQLKAPTTEDYVRIRKESTDNKPFLHQEEGKVPVVLNHEIPDNDLSAKLLNDCTILAWEGFYSDTEKTKAIECTLENKTKLMRLEDSTFRDFVTEKLKALVEARKARNEEVRKNLLNGQNG